MLPIGYSADIASWGKWPTGLSTWCERTADSSERLHLSLLPCVASMLMWPLQVLYCRWCTGVSMGTLTNLLCGPTSSMLWSTVCYDSILNITSRFSAFYTSETILWWTGLGFSVICCTVYVLHEPWLTTKLSHLALLWRHVHLGQTTVNQENSNIFNQMIMMMYIFSSPIIGFTVVDNW